jgi:probable phosphoglycerate mutase
VGIPISEAKDRHLKKLTTIYLARHGETEWSRTGQHTGRVDLPLTPQGEIEAQRLGERLRKLTFGTVITSPLQRARRTCEIAGFAPVAVVNPDAMEWNYGDYEGITRAQVQETRPGWKLFRDGCPNGENATDVGERADRIVEAVHSLEGNVLIFSHGHFLRVFTCRWLGIDPSNAHCLALNTAALSILGFGHDEDDPVIRLWNDTHHLEV